MKCVEAAELTRIIPIAAKLFGHVNKLAEGRTGCYFCLGDVDSGAPLLISMFGEVALPEKAAAYLANAQEKCRRVVETHTVLASETKVENQKYAGAVWTECFIYSVSGYPEFLDEAAMIILAVLCGDLGAITALDLGKNSSNPYFEPLWKLAMPSSLKYPES
jgi:hypothetical protein